MLAPMRSLALLGLAAAAAACGDNTGLVLTISAPDVPASARRIEVVLASADEAHTVMVGGQLRGGRVRYYRQRSTAGVFPLHRTSKSLDGFVVRIEAQDGAGDESFVPLVFAYEGEGEELAAGAQPIAAGAVLGAEDAVIAGERLPLALPVPAGSRLEATATLIPLQAADPALGVLSGQILEVECPAGGLDARSGVAWQPPAKTQLRLLRPEPGGKEPLDATLRGLDLDCDGFAAGGDCDDVRPQYNPRAVDACDGVDMNCDGSSFAVQGCTLAQAACADGTQGVELCHDADPPSKASECLPTPACQCQLGTCSKCVFSFVLAGLEAKPCAPGVSELPFSGTCSPSTPCTVEVLRVDGPWRAAVAADPEATFDLRADVTRNAVQLRVKLDEDSVDPKSVIGALHLAISGGVPDPLYLRVDLQLQPGGVPSCSGVALPDGEFKMECN